MDLRECARSERERKLASDPVRSADTVAVVDRRDLPSDEATLAGEPLERRDSTLDEQADDPTAGRAAGPAVPARRLGRGDEVGRYVILERVGAGGMGVVYAAWDPKLDRKVALKLLHSDKKDHGQRLEREAQAMARLTHPNVIAVHDVGELDDRVFVAMEFVEGQTLAEWANLARGRQEAPRPEREPPEREQSELLEVLLAAGRGLAAAHAHGLVHRDFKPDNVMIDDDGRVRVMDFGLVRAAGEVDEGESPSPSTEPALPEQRPQMHAELDSRSAFDSELTMAGALLGTPAYMAPEQLRGEEADARADQFAFCVVAWQCLYGERPFAGDTPLAVLFAITHAKFHEPEPGRVVPSWIRRVLERGMAADPRARWPDMPSLLRALADDPRARRRPWLLGGLSLAVAVAAASAAIALRPPPPPSPCAHAGDELRELWTDAREAELARRFGQSELVYADETWLRVRTGLGAWSSAWVAAREDACAATEVRHEQSAELLDLRMACLDQRLHRFAALVTVLAEADDTVIEKGVEAVEALPPLEPCSDRSWLIAAVRPPEEPELAAEVEAVREDLARVTALCDGGKAAEALPLAKAAEARARELGWQPLIAEAAMNLGRVRQERGEFSKSRAALEQAYFASRRGSHDQVSVESAALLVYTLAIGLAEFDASSRWIEHLLAEAERIGRPELLAEAYSAVGIHHYSRAEMAEAAAAFERSLELQSDAKSTDLASAHINYGTVLIRVDLDHGDRAIAEIERGSEMLIERVGPRHPAVAVALSNQATVHGYLTQRERAVELLERALEIDEQTLGESHPMTALVELNLAKNLTELDDPKAHARALDFAERSAKVHREVFGESHVMVAQSERAIGAALLQLGRADEAPAHLDAALEIWRASFGDTHAETLETLRLRARCEAALGRVDRARAILEGALELELDDRPRAEVQLALASILAEADPERARELLDAAANDFESRDELAISRIAKLRDKLEPGDEPN
jgi:serine/threonine protein kinase/tetratricopeptide (TPR) repeat protein